MIFIFLMVPIWETAILRKSHLKVIFCHLLVSSIRQISASYVSSLQNFASSKAFKWITQGSSQIRAETDNSLILKIISTCTTGQRQAVEAFGIAASTKF